MKRKLRHLLPIALLLCSALNINAEVLTGSCGTNLTYSLDTSTGLLEIKGTGPMVDYSYQSAPWYSNSSSIKECDISEGVTTIGECAFYYCFGLTSVTIPNSVTKIGNIAFAYCN